MLVSSAVLNFISVYYHLLFTPLFCIYCIIALCFRLGAAFCPLIPALSVMKLFLYFYIKKVCNSVNFNEVDFISSYQVHSCSFLKHNIVDILMYIPRFRIHNNDEFTFNRIKLRTELDISIVSRHHQCCDLTRHVITKSQHK